MLLEHDELMLWLRLLISSDVGVRRNRSLRLYASRRTAEPACGVPTAPGLFPEPWRRAPQRR